MCKEVNLELDLGLTMGKRNRVQVNEYMQSIDYTNVYFVGDNAYFEEEGKPIPQIVETAIQTAETAAHNIEADINKKEKKPLSLTIMELWFQLVAEMQFPM